jgi:hypothetical protein
MCSVSSVPLCLCVEKNMYWQQALRTEKTGTQFQHRDTGAQRTQRSGKLMSIFIGVVTRKTLSPSGKTICYR